MYYLQDARPLLVVPVLGIITCILDEEHLGAAADSGKRSDIL